MRHSRPGQEPGTVAATASPSPQHGSGSLLPGRPPELVEEVLDNGARVVVLPTPASEPKTGLEPVSIELWVFSGTSAEGLEEHGCAHLLEHMLFKPAPDGSGDLAGAIESLGGDVNAFTSHDETVFHATVPTRAVEAGLDGLVQPVLYPRFDPDELAEEAQVVVEEIRQYRDDPAQHLSQQLFHGLYGEHSYGRPVLGSETDVLAHTAQRLQAYHQRAYAGPRVMLVVVGPVGVDATLRQARTLLGPLPAGGPLPDEPEPRPPSAPRIEVLRRDVREAQILIAWQAPVFEHSDAAALELASVVLGHGDPSRLVSDVRRKRQLVSDVYAMWFAARRSSNLFLQAHTTPALVEPAIAALLEHVRRLGAVPIDAQELARARAVLESDLVYGRETVQGRSHALGYYVSLTGSVDGERRYYEQLSGQTVEHLRRACNDHLAPDRAAIGVVVPEDVLSQADAEALEAAIRRQTRSRAKPRTAAGRVQRDAHGIWHADLPNGIRLRARTDSTVPMVAGWLMWPGGLRLERASHAGATALMARLLTRGTSEREGDALARELGACAATLDGFAGRNSVGLHWECLSPDLPLVVRRALECALDPAFPRHEVDEERRVALQELAADEDDLAQVALKAMLDRLYGEHPFHRPRRGTAEGLQAVDGPRLRGIWDQDYPIGRAVLAVAGDFDVEGLAGLVQAMVEGGESIPSRQPPWPGGPPDRPEDHREIRIERRREQVHVVLGYPALPLSDDRVEALEILMTVLGGQSGRLFQALRERQGLVYHVSAGSSEGVDAGHVTVYAATSRDKLERCRAALDQELDRIVSEPVAAEEIERAKAWLLGQFEAGLQRRSRMAALLGFDEIYGLGATHYLQYAARVGRVDGDMLRSLARDLLHPQHRVVAIVGPDVK